MCSKAKIEFRFFFLNGTHKLFRVESATPFVLDPEFMGRKQALIGSETVCLVFGK